MSLPATFDAYVPSDPNALFALAQFEPKYVPLTALQGTAADIDAAHHASFALAQRLTPPATFAHCQRVHLFGLALLAGGFPAGTPGVPQIGFAEAARRWYHCAILHDIGLSRDPGAQAHPAHAMSFELHGGFMCFEHLNAVEPKLDAMQVGDIVQGIITHTSAYHAGKSSAVAALLKLCTAFDGLGFDAFGPGSLSFLLSRKTVQEIERAYPRGAFGEEALEVMETEAARKPDCLLSHGVLEILPRIAQVKFLVPPDEVCE